MIDSSKRLIDQFQALYGHKSQNDIGGNAPTVPRITTQQPSVEDPALCGDPKFDTILNSANGETCIFKGKYRVDCYLLHVRKA